MNRSDRRAAIFERSFARTAIPLAACLLLRCPAALAEECAPPHLKNTVRMEPVSGGLVMVPVSLDGQERKFLFDTGGVANYVSRTVADQLKLPEFSAYPLLDLRGNRSESAVRVEDVVIGTDHAGYAWFHVAADLPYDGILSARTMAMDNLNLANDDLDIDFGAMTLSFFSSDHCADGSVVTWPHQVLAVVPVDTPQGHIELPVTLDGHPLIAAIDTGSPWTILNLARAKAKLGFSPQAQQPPDGSKDDPAQQIYFRKYSALSLEGITIANPRVIVRPIQFGGKNDPTVLASRAEHIADSANRRAPDIIIGMEILRHLHIYYAVKEQKLYITPSS